MVNQRLLIGSIAFGMSFSIGLLVQRDAGKAIAIAGLITLPATLVAVSTVDRLLYRPAEERMLQLKGHIQALQRRRMEVYQELTSLTAEKDRMTLALSSLEMRLGQPPQLPPAASFRPPISWDLSAAATLSSEKPTSLPDWDIPVPAYTLPTEIQPPPQVTGKPLRRSSDAVSESQVRALQTELGSLQQQMVEQRRNRETLKTEIAGLTQQKQDLEQQHQKLQTDVRELEQCRVELEQFLTYAENKKRELETGSNPLQVALKQLQTQVNSLQSELQQLETQVADRHREKETLEQQISRLQGAAVQPSPPPSGKNGAGAGKPSPPAETPGQKQLATVRATPPKVNAATARSEVAPLPKSDKFERSLPALPEDWEEFMVQLPEYEFQVLRAIAELSNPAPILKKIAEDNLTMPEVLIESINERALDLLGDLIIEPGATPGTAAIARDHTKTVKKLIKTYEYLT